MTRDSARLTSPVIWLAVLAIAASAFPLLAGDAPWIQRHGDFAITAQTGRVEMVHKNGSKESLDWRWTAFREKKGSDWLFRHEHFSTPLMTGPAPEHPKGP